MVDERERDAEIPAVEREGALLVWQVFGAPGLTVALVGAMLALLLVATQVPQGVPAADVAAGHSFSVALFVDGFGLSRVATSWPMALLAVLLALNLAARWLRRRHGAGHGGAEALAGESGEVAAADAVALGKRLQHWFGPSRITVRPDRVEARRGLLREGLLAVVVGGAILGAAGLLHTAAGQSGRIMTRVASPPGMDPREVTQVQVNAGAAWEPGGPRLEVSCQRAPDAADAWACAFAGEGVHATSLLAPGQPAWLPGLRVTLERAEPLRALELVRLGLTNPLTGAEAALEAVPGRPYEVTITAAGGDTDLSLRAIHGVEGPVVAVDASDGVTVVAGLSGAPRDPRSGLPVTLRGLTDERLVLRFATTEHRLVAVVGAVLVLAGLLMIAATGHLAVAAWEVAPGRWAVRVTSLGPDGAILRALQGAPTPEEV
ncbi:MAG: hypothetical protein AMXMBFR64_17010 [Myxococcales bacterium]